MSSPPPGIKLHLPPPLAGLIAPTPLRVINDHSLINRGDAYAAIYNRVYVRKSQNAPALGLLPFLLIAVTCRIYTLVTFCALGLSHQKVISAVN